jgi:sporulation protein YlmC with PRC-barrel domain
MKRQTIIAAHFTLAALLSVSVFADEVYNADTNGMVGNTRWSSSHLQEALKYSKLKGLAVENQSHEKLGKVQDFAVDLKSGRIVAVIISSGGFMGVDSTLTAVPARLFHHDSDLENLQLNLDQDKFNSAPKLEAPAWDTGLASNQVAEVYNYYDGQSSTNPGADPAHQGIPVADTLPRNQDGSINTVGARTMDTVHNQEVAATNGADTLMIQNSWGADTIEKAGLLVGMTVTNLQGETVGKVENLALDLSSGRIVAVIISSGGFMGIGGEYSAVPPSAFTLNDQTNALQLDVSKETFANSPHFTSSDWPDLSQPAYTANVYNSYNVQPYFRVDADNTSRNVRDRDHQNLTPLDQGNSQADLDLTAQIRKEIVAADDMSVNAKNCKIITRDGRVTLRGPVNSDAEKNRIADIANRIARDGKVDNQLEVVSNHNN